MPNKPNKLPVYSFRLGYIGGSVWERQHEDSTYYNVTINRSYKDKDSDKWETSDSYAPDDLPVVQKVAEVCLAWIIRQGNK